MPPVGPPDDGPPSAVAIDLDAPDNEEEIVRRIARACSTVGHFQVRSARDVPPDLVRRFREGCRDFFALAAASPQAADRIRRGGSNSRGYFDDELTQRRVDWKRCLDVGVPGSRDWGLDDADPSNACLDGFNRFPSEDALPGFRAVVVEYFEACAALSHRLAVYMARGLLPRPGERSRGGDPPFVSDLRSGHTSFLRLNYYPPCDSDEKPMPLGISPHRDAGFLTVLLQDDGCHSLQVWRDGEGDGEGVWETVVPEPGALTVNTGDMAQVWSNGRYKAPLHRVLANPTASRHSAPFFYNPPYTARVAPLPISPAPDRSSAAPTPGPGPGPDSAAPLYHPIVWGYFRAVRFAGDVADLGSEIQIHDYVRHRQHEREEEEESDGDGKDEPPKPTRLNHVNLQDAFADEFDVRQPFRVEKFRNLLDRHHQHDHQ